MPDIFHPPNVSVPVFVRGWTLPCGNVRSSGKFGNFMGCWTNISSNIGYHGCDCYVGAIRMMVALSFLIFERQWPIREKGETHTLECLSKVLDMHLLRNLVGRVSNPQICLIGWFNLEAKRPTVLGPRRFWIWQKIWWSFELSLFLECQSVSVFETTGRCSAVNIICFCDTIPKTVSLLNLDLLTWSPHSVYISNRWGIVQLRMNSYLFFPF